MAHKTQQHYPQFAELLLLHSKITGSSTRKIKSLAASCNPDMLRQLFLIFTKFFLNESNRIKYFDSQHPSSSTNQSIITALSDAFRRYPASTPSPSPFDQLPTMLLSKCISFLSQKDRCATLKVNKLFLNAASTSIAKYHLVINRAFLKRNKSKTAQQILSFHNLYSVGALTIKNSKSHRHSLWNHKSMENLKYLLTKNNIKTMCGNPPLVKIEDSKDTLSDHVQAMRSIESIDIMQCDLCWTDPFVSSAKTVTNICSNHHLHLWIKDPFKEYEESADSPELQIPKWMGSTSIKQYILGYSKVQHLTFCRMIMGPFHPLFWLWNIDSLHSCSLEMDLPPSPRSKYMQQFADLLSSELVVERARNQRTFKSLRIRLNVQSTDPLDVDHYVATNRTEDIQNRWESFAENYNVLLRYLNRLYPNLTALTIIVQDFDGLHDAITNGMVHNEDIHRMNIKLPFRNLQRLEVNVMSIDDAIDLFGEMNQHSTIKNVAVLFEVDWSERLKVMDLMEAKFKFVRSHCEMLEMVGVYFEHFGYSVHGVTEQMQMEWHWKVYSRYLSLITEMVESGVIIDGHLRFEMNIMRSSIYRNNTVNVEWGRTVWNKNNVEQSLLTAQRICRIQSAVKQYNDRLGDSECNEKKLVLSIPGLILYEEHRKFVEFWFNDPILCQYDWNCIRFVMC